MITARRVRRPVHIVTAYGVTACGASRRELLAIGADNDDRPGYVTCPRCKRMAPRHCSAWVITSI
jgi:hypothetical protein